MCCLLLLHTAACSAPLFPIPLWWPRPLWRPPCGGPPVVPTCWSGIRHERCSASPRKHT